MRDFLKVLWKYIVQYRFVAAVFVLFCIIFLGIFSLYKLELEAIVYAATLCIFCSVIILCIHFLFYYKKHCELTNIRKNIDLLNTALPPSSNLLEDDFCEIIGSLQKINKQINAERMSDRKESIDYYTTWVHQIKAPIAVMRLLLQGDDTAENKELLSELFRIEEYTEMVLCYFRIDSASSDFVIQQNDLNGIIRQAIRKFAPQFVRKKIKLNYQTTTLKVLTDEKWLLFIIEQLLSNAIKYTSTGSITIAVHNPELLSITDTGIGIAAEDLPRIFEKGFTGYNGHANKKSTGLGLYLCKRTADKLSHKISISSCAGRGTTVTINLHSEKIEIE